MKKNRQYIKLLQILEWNGSNRISTYGSRKQGVPSGNISYEKSVLVRVNERRATLELELMLWLARGRE